MDQPVATVTLTRPWGWGGAFLHDADDRPAASDDRLVELNLRHATDVEINMDPVPLAESTITVTSWTAEPSIVRPGRPLGSTVIPTPSRRLYLGDPEYAIALPTAHEATHVRVSGEGASWGDDQIWVDLWPAT